MLLSLFLAPHRAYFLPDGQGDEDDVFQLTRKNGTRDGGAAIPAPGDGGPRLPNGTALASSRTYFGSALKRGINGGIGNELTSATAFADRQRTKTRVCSPQSFPF